MGVELGGGGAGERLIFVMYQTTKKEGRKRKRGKERINEKNEESKRERERERERGGERERVYLLILFNLGEALLTLKLCVHF